VHVAAAMTYTLLVLFAALLAKGQACGRPGLARALLAAGLMLRLSSAPPDRAPVPGPHRHGGPVAADLAADRPAQPTVACAVLSGCCLPG